MEARDSHRLANKLDSRESDTDSQGGPRMVRVAESVMVTRNSHRLANEPDSRESDTDSHNPICESTITAINDGVGALKRPFVQRLSERCSVSHCGNKRPVYRQGRTIR